MFDGYSDTGFSSKLPEQVEPFNTDAFACAGMAYCLSKRFVIYYLLKNTVRTKNSQAKTSVTPESLFFEPLLLTDYEEFIQTSNLLILLYQSLSRSIIGSLQPVHFH